MRVALGGLWHETNAFAPSRTTLQDFRDYQYADAEELVERYAETGTEAGGAIRAARDLGVELVPLPFAAAVPSGLVEADAFATLSERLIAAAADAAPLDGVVLVMHGAMQVEGVDDPEAELVAAVRAVTGSAPVAATLDFHANVSPRLAELLTVVSIYRTYPHVDMADRGDEAMRLLHRAHHEERPVRVYLRKLPLLTVPQVQGTADEPMRVVLDARDRVAAHPGVWSASVAPGYPYCDVDRLGLSLCAVAESDPAPVLDREADRIWAAREQMRAELVSVEEAVARAGRGPHPTVLADVADNVGGGSPGDGTSLLRALREAGLGGVVSVIWDPGAVAELYESDAPATAIAVGAKSTSLMGEPVVIEGAVERLGAVSYRRSGGYMSGSEVALGRVGVVHDRVGPVVLTERRVLPFDRDHLEAVGIDVAAAGTLVVKGATAWREPFEDLARQVAFVDCPGYCPSDLSTLPYTKRPAGMWPLDNPLEEREIA